MDRETLKARRRRQLLIVSGIAAVMVFPVVLVLSVVALAFYRATPAPVATSNAVLDQRFRAQEIDLPAQGAGAGTGKLTLNIALPGGYAFNGQAPFTLHVYNDQVVTVDNQANDLKITLPTMPVSVPIALKAGQTSLTMDSRVYYCEIVNENYCIPAQFRFVVPLTVTEGTGSADLQLAYQVQVPKPG
ncbi:MAG TPA: hypothetical protein VMT34_06955 [Aggregatilineales bacterium]|nr:hypothetical protein [Aggregatilineales bacterium]